MHCSGRLKIFVCQMIYWSRSQLTTSLQGMYYICTTTVLYSVYLCPLLCVLCICVLCCMYCVMCNVYLCPVLCVLYTVLCVLCCVSFVVCTVSCVLCNVYSASGRVTRVLIAALICEFFRRLQSVSDDYYV